MSDTTRIISYNVNGIRAAMKKGLLDWLKAADPTVLCMQEVKALPEQVDLEPFEALGYRVHWFPAEKKGYSGVAMLSKKEPIHVEKGMGMPQYDSEGRLLRLDFEDFSVLSVYMPSGSSGDPRQDFKMQWLEDFTPYIQELRKSHPNLIISGDYNICHKPIDIHNPVANKNSSGFLPEEREWFSQFLETGFVDTFRMFNEEPDHYTWWSFRAAARERNKGWRIDYHLATESMQSRITRAAILPEAKHSDHCPILVEIGEN